MLFGSAPQQQAPSLFGGGSGFGAPQAPSLFGGSQQPQQQPQQQGGGLFGGSQQQQQQQGGGLFGQGAPSAGASLFGQGAPGMQPQQQTSSMFSTGALRSPTQGTSLFGNPMGGSSLFSPQPQQQQQQQQSMFGGQQQGFGSGMGAFGNPAATAPAAAAGKPIISYKQYTYVGFQGAANLLPFTDAPDLKVGALPAGRENSPQAYLSAGLVPEPLKTELIEQQAEIDAQDRLLSQAMGEAPSDLDRLLKLTSQMDLSVQALRNSLARQRQAVEQLVDEAKASGRACEQATSDVRRVNKAAFTVDKPLPSDFFWALLHRLEQTLAEYQQRCVELKQAAASLSKPSSGATLADIVELSKQQHRAYKLVEQNVATVHRMADGLRAKYVEHVRATRGETPSFDEDDKREKERNRRMLRKVEEQAKAQISKMSQPRISTLAQQQTSPTSSAGWFGQPAQAPGAGGASSASGGMFGSAAPQQQASSLFGQSAAAAAAPGGMFGGSAPTSGVFGGGDVFSSPHGGSGLLGGAASHKRSTMATTSRKRS